MTFTIQAVVALGALETFHGARRLEARSPAWQLCGRVLGFRGLRIMLCIVSVGVYAQGARNRLLIVNS